MSIKVNSNVNSQHKLNNLVDILINIRSSAKIAIAISSPTFSATQSPHLKSGIDFFGQSEQVYGKVEYVEEKEEKNPKSLAETIEENVQKMHHKIHQFANDSLNQLNNTISTTQETPIKVSNDDSLSSSDKPPNEFIKRMRKEINDHYKNGGTATSLRKKGEKTLKQSFTQLCVTTLFVEKKKQQELPKALKEFSSLISRSEAREYLQAQHEFLYLLIQLIDEHFEPTLTRELKDNAEKREQLQIKLTEKGLLQQLIDFPLFYSPYGDCLFHARCHLEDPLATAFSNGIHSLLSFFSNQTISKQFSNDLKALAESWKAYDQIFTAEYVNKGNAVLENL